MSIAISAILSNTIRRHVLDVCGGASQFQI